MDSKLVLITGANSGIGKATALLAAKEGWDVIITYKHKQKEALNVVQHIQSLGQHAEAFKLNLANEHEITHLFSYIAQHYKKLDALINNAGIITPIASFSQYSAQRIQDVFTINVVGTFLTSKEAVKLMTNQEYGGNIVNVSSAASRLGSPNEFIDYAASKGAIDTFTIGLAKEVAKDGIRVNCVRPGLINTSIHSKAGDAQRAEKLKRVIPMQRPGETSEVAEAIVWLISDKASYVNGSLLDVAGGR